MGASTALVAAALLSTLLATAVAAQAKSGMDLIRVGTTPSAAAIVASTHNSQGPSLCLVHSDKHDVFGRVSRRGRSTRLS